MKKLLLICFLMVNIISVQSQTIDTFLEKWENSKTYLLEIAKAMPEEYYDYKPTEREMSFGKQLLHIRDNMNWLSNTYFTTNKYKKEEDLKNHTKQEIIALLEKSFSDVSTIIAKAKVEDLNTKVDFFAGPKTKLQILNLLQDHVTHHRGQIIVYLNLNNIQPPKYVGW